MKNSTVPAARRAELSEFIAARLGLHFPPARWMDLERGLAAAAPDFGLANAAACADWLLSAALTKANLDVLASHLTIGETYFFREKKAFEALAQSILPELIATRRGRGRRLRIWSAACCTGEEPYSLAILLAQILPDLADWHVTLLATDINQRFLRKAAAGVYGDWSFRDAPEGFKEKYFRRTADNHYAILPEVRKRVTFQHLNLVDDLPSLAIDSNAMDLILCRNVLMYFTAAQAEKVAANLRRALVNDGWLAVSSTEGSQVLFSLFEPVTFPGVSFYQKSRRKTPETPAFFLTPVEPPTPPADAEPERKSREMAEALYEEGRYAEAAGTLLSQLETSLPPEAESFSLLARALANEGKLPEALAACERWLAADKLDASGHYLRAMVVQELGDSGEARRSLQRAIYLDQDFVLAHFALGNLAREAGRLEEAEKHFANSLTLLERSQPEDVLPEAEGLTAARLTEIIQSLNSLEPAR